MGEYEAEDGPEFIQVYQNTNTGTWKAAQECEHCYCCRCSLVAYSLLGHGECSWLQQQLCPQQQHSIQPPPLPWILQPLQWLNIEIPLIGPNWHQLGISSPAPPTHMSPLITDPCNQLWSVTCIDAAPSPQPSPLDYWHHHVHHYQQRSQHHSMLMPGHSNTPIWPMPMLWFTGIIHLVRLLCSSFF